MKPNTLKKIAHLSACIANACGMYLTLRETLGLAEDYFTPRGKGEYPRGELISDIEEMSDADIDDVADQIAHPEILFEDVTNGYLDIMPASRLRREKAEEIRKLREGYWDMRADEGLDKFHQALFDFRTWYAQPKVLNLYKMDLDQEDGIFCGRPGKFGNLFPAFGVGGREEAVSKHSEYLNKHPELIELADKRLRGLNLVCFCAPKKCHCDNILKALADMTRKIAVEPEELCYMRQSSNSSKDLTHAVQTLDDAQAIGKADLSVENTPAGFVTRALGLAAYNHQSCMVERGDPTPKEVIEEAIDAYLDQSGQVITSEEFVKHPTPSFAALQCHPSDGTVAYKYAGNQVVMDCVDLLTHHDISLPAKEQYTSGEWKDFEKLTGALIQEHHDVRNVGFAKRQEPIRFIEKGSGLKRTPGVNDCHIYLAAEPRVVGVGFRVNTADNYVDGSNTILPENLLLRELRDNDYRVRIISERLRYTFPRSVILVSIGHVNNVRSLTMSVCVTGVDSNIRPIGNRMYESQYALDISWDFPSAKPREDLDRITGAAANNSGIVHAAALACEHITHLVRYAGVDKHGYLVELGLPSRVNLGVCALGLTNITTDTF